MERGDVGRRVVLWIACLAWAGCGDATSSCKVTKTLDTSALDDEIEKRFAADGLVFDDVTCPEEFAYTKEQPTLACTAKLGAQEIALPVEISAKGSWTTEPVVEDRLVLTRDDVTTAFTRVRQDPAGPYAGVDCAPRVWFWKGKERASCKITVEDKAMALIVIRDGKTSVRFETSEPTLDLLVTERELPNYFKERLGIEGATADCGKPRLLLPVAERRLECAAAWPGGKGLLRVILRPQDGSVLLVEAEGLSPSGLAKLVASEWEGEPGSWRCPGTEAGVLRRGEPVVCDFLAGRGAGGKTRRLKATPDETTATMVFTDAP